MSRIHLNHVFQSVPRPNGWRMDCAVVAPTGKRRAILALLFAGLATVVGYSAPVPNRPPVNFADLTLEQLMDIKVGRVYGASRQVQKVTQAPSSVSIVTAEEIQQFGWRTLGDILRSVRGFYLSNDRNYTYLGARGFLRPGDYNTRVLVLIDGHRMNDNVFDTGYVDRAAMISPDLIEQVEVIRGPSSSVYGSSAFLGVVNVVTKRGQSNGAELATDIGDNGSYEGRFSLNHRFRNRIEWSFSGTYFTDDGERRLYFPEYDQRISEQPGATNNGVAENSDGERAKQIFTTLVYGDLTLSAFLNHRRKNVPTASFATVFNHQTEHTLDRRGYFDLKFDRTFDQNRMVVRAFYDKDRYEGFYPYDYAEPGDPPDVLVGFDGSKGEWIGTEFQFDAKLSERNAIIVGAEFRENLHEDQFSFIVGEPDLLDRRRSRNLGVFAQWETSLRRNLVLTAGARYDHYFGSFGGTLNPRLGLIYHPTETLTIKALSGSAFRAPNPYERFYFDVSRLELTLQPERIHTQELVVERYWGSAYRSTFSLYHYDIESLISQGVTAAGDLYYMNEGDAHAEGAELELEAKYESGLFARVSYGVQRTEDRASRTRLTSSPVRLGKLNLAWSPPGHRFSAGLELQYQSPMQTLAGAESEDVVIANAHLFSARLLRSWEISLLATNLFDTRYGIPGAEDHVQDLLEQPARGLRLKLVKKF